MIPNVGHRISVPDDTEKSSVYAALQTLEV